MEPRLVGRHWEMTAVEDLLDRALTGCGRVVGVVGPSGIGKSRLARDVAALARRRNVEVFSTFCESHATDVSFRVVARLLRAAFGVEDRDAAGARARIRGLVRDADPEDLALLDDLLAITDPDAEPPTIAPDARRRRLTALINAASLARQAPTVYVIEDAHWIDGVSESMLADFVTMIAHTPSLVLVTYRPEYRGALIRVADAYTVALAPLSDSETAALVCESLGDDPSVGELGHKIAQRAGGNPFFAEEIVRELAERGVLQGRTGAHTSTADPDEATVPATLQATVGARIDRLDPNAKQTLSAAAVIGSRFGLDLLTVLVGQPMTTALLAAQVIDQVSFTGQPEYAFHHPLIRAVAYESQPKSDRAELHGRVAAAMESGDRAEENASLIAEHLEAAGDVHRAYSWHMRAATWATNRDINAARLGWKRAQRIADALPATDPNRTAMRIAPRTMLCGTAYRVHEPVAGNRFDELRDLCVAVGDKASLAIAMAALVMDEAWLRRASQLASETWFLIESVGDPALTVGLSTVLLRAKIESGGWLDILRWSQRVIELADGDPAKGNFGFGSPLAAAFAARGQARYCLGHSGWRDDLYRAIDLARSSDTLSYAGVVTYSYLPAIPFGVLVTDERAEREIDDALCIAGRSGDDVAVALSRMALGIALVHRPTDPERERGQKLLAEVGDVLRRGYLLCDLPLVNAYLARERFRRGDHDEALALIRAAADEPFREIQLTAWGIPVTGILVETLLERGTEADVAEAEAAVERLATAPANDGLVIRDIWLLRLWALLARARGDDARYRGYRDRYREMAKTLGSEGHIAWAEVMP
ncbi:ATP-binding protein [Mycobacterium sp. 94-17]|uniref:ATP-binding protein n=1 Tax=Mycobacterium sp. 94-17 TaxID=2986147 RepID=UPI002D1E6AC0|nr:AAA family ATPase [Mycobacterium sp. 94-17]MEB4207996.1 AAA family ATPase [Mycobacterium sp. 94-17]